MTTMFTCQKHQPDTPC